MIDNLVNAGYRFGGVLTGVGAPDSSSEYVKTDRVANAPTLFLLNYTEAAKVDGIGMKSLELARALAEVKRTSGAKRISLVAFSAGGLVSRAYLQSAFLGVEYSGDVERLITLSTPHLGAAMAVKIGDLLGLKANSLRPDAPLIQKLNATLELPIDVKFASVVVRGRNADERGKGGSYDAFVDAKLLTDLPVSYREGGDQAVHVRSQNLALTQTAARYGTGGHPQPSSQSHFRVLLSLRSWL